MQPIAQLLSAALLVLVAPWASAQADATAPGRALFEHYCTRCHGANADGQSALGKLLTPQPANLRTSRLDAVQLADIIAAGGAARGRSPSMPAWGDQISSIELLSLVQYVASVRGTQQP